MFGLKKYFTIFVSTIIVFSFFYSLKFTTLVVKAECVPSECANCEPGQVCFAKCCKWPGGGGGGGGGETCTRSCNGTNCNKVPAGCSPVTSSSCNNDCDCGASGCGGGGGGTPAPTATPSPSCTVTLSPDPVSISESATQDYTASVVPSNGSVSTVNFLSNNTSIATVSPASDTTSAYTTTATGQSAGSTTIRAGVVMSGSERCSDTASITITPPDPWWQVMDADVLSLGDLISLIPATLGEEFILSGSGGFPGIAIYGGTTADFSAGSGTGTVSPTNWLGNTSAVSQKSFNYAYFEGIVPADVIFNEITSTSVAGSSFTSGGILSRGYYWYRFDGTTGSTQNQDLTISSSINLGSRRVILFVKGANVNIAGDVSLSDGSGFFLTIAGENISGNKGDIVIDPSVVGLEGVYFADGTFKTGSLGADADSQLNIRGAVAAYGGMVLERDLASDATTPAEFFEYGLDQILLYPPSLSVRKIRWKEVAP